MDEVGAMDEPAEAGVPNRTLLYIDDEPGNLALVARIVRSRDDLRLVQAPSGRIGLDLARSTRPDLILLDLRLPDIDGAAVLRMLREGPATQDIPVIVTSAEPALEMEARALALGAQGYLEKPIRISRFWEIVAPYVD